MKEEPIKLLVGSLIKQSPGNADPDCYILAQTEASQFNLISLLNGNRYGRPVASKNGTGIIQSEWKKWREQLCGEAFNNAVFTPPKYSTGHGDWQSVNEYFTQKRYKKTFQITRGGDGREIEAFHKNKEVRVGCAAVSLATLKEIVDYLDNPVE